MIFFSIWRKIKENGKSFLDLNLQQESNQISDRSVVLHFLDHRNSEV